MDNRATAVRLRRIATGVLVAPTLPLRVGSLVVRRALDRAAEGARRNATRALAEEHRDRIRLEAELATIAGARLPAARTAAAP